MKIQNQLNTVLVATVLFAGTALASGNQGLNLNEMIDSANTSYRAVRTEGFSDIETNLISNRLIALSNTPMAASALSLEGQVLLRGANDPTAMLHIDSATRTIVFNRGIADIGGANSTPALTSIEAAPAVAKSLLAELELAPEKAEEMTLEHVGGLNMGLEGPGGATQVFEKVRTVRFGRRLDGKKVLGRGSRMVVELGAEGEMRGVVRRWDEVAPTSIAPEAKFTAAEIREMIAFRVKQASSEAQSVEFTSAELVLFDDGKGVIEPAIRFEFEMTIVSEFRNEDGNAEQREVSNPFDFFVPILRNPKAEMPFAKDIQMNHNLPDSAK